MSPTALEDLYASVEAEHARREYRDRYWSRPSAWAEECIAWRPDRGERGIHPYQADTLDELVVHKREAARSLHGVGKTMLASLAILWFATTRDGLPDDWKIPTTAGSWRQLVKYLWPELHKWARRLRWDRLGRGPFTPNELLDLSLKLRTGEAFAMASDNPGMIEGAHAPHMLFVFDEAKSIPSSLWDAAEGAFMGAEHDERLVLAISTPGSPSGRFYSICSRKPGYEDWHARHITLADSITAGRMTQAIADQRGRQWGRESALYLNRVLGEFAASEESAVIPLAWYEAAVDRWHALYDGDAAKLPGQMETLGVDIAGGGVGGNETVLAPRHGGWLVPEIEALETSKPMETVAKVAARVLANPGSIGVLEPAGIGAGALDRLLEMGVDVLPFLPNGRAPRLDRTGTRSFKNLRSAAWWYLRDRLDPGNEEHPMPALPPDDQLAGDLCAPRWRELTGGPTGTIIEVEPKRPGTGRGAEQEDGARWGTVAARLGRSPDRGDAVVIAFARDLLFGPEPPPEFESNGHGDGAWAGGIPAEEIGGNFLDNGGNGSPW